MNEQELVKLVTEKVIEALRQQEAASVPMPAAPQVQPAAGAQSGSCTGESGLRMTVRDLEEAKPGAAPDEVVIGVAPAFGKQSTGFPIPTFCGKLPRGSRKKGFTRGLSAFVTFRTFRLLHSVPRS